MPLPPPWSRFVEAKKSLAKLGNIQKVEVQGLGRISYKKEGIVLPSTTNSSWGLQLLAPSLVVKITPSAVGIWTRATSVWRKVPDHCATVRYEKWLLICALIRRAVKKIPTTCGPISLCLHQYFSLLINSCSLWLYIIFWQWRIIRITLWLFRSNVPVLGKLCANIVRHWNINMLICIIPPKQMFAI
jgi:hypothetical protein